MESLGNILQKNIDAYGLTDAAFASLLVEHTKKYIAQVFGRGMIKEVTHISYQNNIVRISVKHSASMQEIFYEKRDVLEYLRKVFPLKPVCDIVVALDKNELSYSL